MHENAIDRNCLFQLAEGVKPWTCNVPAGQNPLPYFTSRHIGRALYGFRLSKKGNWKPCKDCPDDTVTHLIWYVGMYPDLGKSFQFNTRQLAREIKRDGNGGNVTRATTALHSAEWYRAITAFPGLYAAALKQVYS